jgi:hypothetical protein
MSEKTICKYKAFSSDGVCLLTTKCICQGNEKILAEWAKDDEPEPWGEQEPDGPVCSTEIREPSEVVNFLEAELSTANTRIKELEAKCKDLQGWRDSHL